MYYWDGSAHILCWRHGSVSLFRFGVILTWIPAGLTVLVALWPPEVKVWRDERGEV